MTDSLVITIFPLICPPLSSLECVQRIPGILLKADAIFKYLVTEPTDISQSDSLFFQNNVDQKLIKRGKKASFCENKFLSNSIAL